MRFRLPFTLPTFVVTTTLALAGSPSDEFRGYFYNPTKNGGCYEDGLVFHVKKDRITRSMNGDERDYLEDLIITNVTDSFVVEGLPSTSATIKNQIKKLIITYKNTDTGFIPVAITADDIALDAKSASKWTMVENGYSLRRCDSPSFLGWLLMTIGWHTAFEKTSDQ